MTVEPAGRLYQALVETKKASAGRELDVHARRPGRHHLLGAGAGERLARRRARRAARHASRTSRAKPDHRRRGRPRAREGAARFRRDAQRSAAARRRAVRGDRARRLAALLPAARPLAQAHGRRRAARRSRVPEARQPDARASSFPTRSPTARRRRPPSTSPRWSRTTRAIAGVAAGEAFDPTPANLEARTQRFTLPNGMKVALLPKKTRGETVQFQLRLHHGDEASLKGMAPRGSLAAAMLALGTKKRDRQAFEDALDQLRAKLSHRRQRDRDRGARRRPRASICPTCCGSPPRRCASRRSRRPSSRS